MILAHEVLLPVSMSSQVGCIVGKLKQTMMSELSFSPNYALYLYQSYFYTLKRLFCCCCAKKPLSKSNKSFFLLILIRETKNHARI